MGFCFERSARRKPLLQKYYSTLTSFSRSMILMMKNLGHRRKVYGLFDESLNEGLIDLLVPEMTNLFQKCCHLTFGVNFPKFQSGTFPKAFVSVLYFSLHNVMSMPTE